jgi:hypothetical protein
MAPLQRECPVGFVDGWHLQADGFGPDRLIGMTASDAGEQDRDAHRQ